jgi:hypothetical protein
MSSIIATGEMVSVVREIFISLQLFILFIKILDYDILEYKEKGRLLTRWRKQDIFTCLFLD